MPVVVREAFTHDAYTRHPTARTPEGEEVPLTDRNDPVFVGWLPRVHLDGVPMALPFGDGESDALVRVRLPAAATLDRVLVVDDDDFHVADVVVRQGPGPIGKRWTQIVARSPRSPLWRHRAVDVNHHGQNDNDREAAAGHDPSSR